MNHEWGGDRRNDRAAAGPAGRDSNISGHADRGCDAEFNNRSGAHGYYPASQGDDVELDAMEPEDAPPIP